jgi:hypothetical protein
MPAKAKTDATSIAKSLSETAAKGLAVGDGYAGCCEHENGERYDVRHFIN